ncbi:MAG: hypothetical protein PHH26_03120 [Candidatus Thermoplasmatota archaeon]|nr:hypothetical protein [Candidatus Thermoplasmatota archaeon]
MEEEQKKSGNGGLVALGVVLIVIGVLFAIFGGILGSMSFNAGGSQGSGWWGQSGNVSFDFDGSPMVFGGIAIAVIGAVLAVLGARKT